MRLRVLGAIQNDDTAHHAHLRRGEAHAGRVIHGFQHVVGQATISGVISATGSQGFLETRVGMDQDRTLHGPDLRAWPAPRNAARSGV